MNERAFLTVFNLLPKSVLSRTVGAATRLPLPAAVHQAAIRTFARRYAVDLDEVELPLEQYPTFGDFFTRRLREGARPVAPGAELAVSPVDGVVAAQGCSEAGRMLQAKGRDYALAALLDDPVEAQDFQGGCYATIYLSPRDYHRIHAPLDGVIEALSYLPGKLFPVNQPSVRSVPNLFCVNERLTTYLRTPLGRVAVVKVGATCVGRIRAAYDDVVSNAGRGPLRRRYDRPIPIAKGEELGVFEMGSTVILLFERGRVEFDPAVVDGAKLRMGQPLARPVGAARG